MAEGELPGLTSWDEVDRTANPVREAYFTSQSKRKHDETNKGLDNDDSDHEGKKVCFAGLTAEHQRRSLDTCEDLFEAFEEVFEEVLDEKNKVAIKVPTWTSQEESTEMKVVQQEEPAAIDVTDPKTEEVPFFKSGSSQ
ncbi:hypothetical protein BGZ88_008415 [Linnemannia elongata]|nr:hypothetical protein BGZ88_008415 [Linnemannia elongata]